MRRAMVVGLAVAVMAAVPAVARSAGQHSPPQSRSGTIIGGPDTMGSMPCGLAAECAAWLKSGCDPALAGRNPALMTSIVDVAELADGTTERVVGVSKTILWSTVRIQFWSEACAEIGDCPILDDVRPGDPTWNDWLGLANAFGCRAAEMKYDSARSWSGYSRSASGYDEYFLFRVPRGARWMTVGASAAVNVHWALWTP